jgi:hypothetical protein
VDSYRSAFFCVRREHQISKPVPGLALIRALRDRLYIDTALQLFQHHGGDARDGLNADCRSGCPRTLGFKAGTSFMVERSSYDIATQDRKSRD